MAAPTINFIMSASESLKRPAGAEAEPETDEPAQKVPRVSQPHSFKNVFKQLSLMRPGLFFEMETDPNATVGEDGIPSSYQMGVDVDGVKFKGIGPSKRNAKVQAAEQVLAHLESLGVKPREPTEEEKPVKSTEPKVKTEAYVGLTEEQKAEQQSGKNPVMMLHEIRPNFDSEIESDERRGAHRKVVISVTVEGTKYVGVGRSNKNARARAAVAALNAMFGLEFKEFGENEIPVYLGDEWNWRKYTKRAEKSAGGQAQQKGDNTVKQIKNAVMQLNDMYKGLEFTVIERTGPDHCPFFRVSVDIEGQKYEGEGSTKKSAKLGAAEHALEGLGQTGVLASRTSAKKHQQNWNKKGGPSWDSKGNFVHQNENGNMGGFGQGGSGSYWADREQNGQAGVRGRGRGGRGGPRGRGGQMRGGGRGVPIHGGPMRGRGAPRGRGAWGSGGENANSGATLLGGIGRGRGGAASMLPPPPPPPLPSARGRGARGKGGRGSAAHMANMAMPSGSWGVGSSTPGTGTDYSSYQDPYTSDTSSGWNSQSYGYDGKAYGQSYGYDSKSYADNSYAENSYADNSYDTSYDTSYDKTFGGGNNSYLNDSSYKSYQAADTSNAAGSWGEYYGY